MQLSPLNASNFGLVQTLPVPTSALGRPYCSGGSVLCRGTTSAISRYDHAVAISDDDMVSNNVVFSEQYNLGPWVTHGRQLY